MNKKLLLAGAFVSLWGTAALAQTPVALDRKWNGVVEHQFQQEQANLANGLKSIANDTKGYVISCTDADAVAEAIRLNGYEVTVIGNNIISAQLPLNYVRELVEMEEVLYVNGSRKFRPTMNQSRVITGADKIQNGTGLETPFTGKGVILGVIDQGFEYKHIAFLDMDKNSRVRAVWNHFKHRQPTTTTPTGGDGITNSHGHATHVTNIAAGSKVEGNDYYGIAPDAEIIMIPSNFDEADVLEEAKYISDFAKKEGKPFVINMSFGSQIGPHDGSDDYCAGMNAIAEEGGVLVAAMGNENGLKIHGYHKFTKENEKVYLILDNKNVSFNYLDLWGQNADGKQHLKITPIIFNKISKTKTPQDDSFWRSCAQFNANVAPYNQKENHSFQVNIQAMKSKISGGSANSSYFGIEIMGNPGDEFHAWVNPGWGEIYKPIGSGYIQGDSDYLVGEGAAIIPHAVAVASFDGNNGDFISANDGTVYNFKANQGAVSAFSSHGPSLGDAPKPLVAAPGHVIASAVSRYYDGFNSKTPEIVSIIKNGANKYYYEVMSGTSMASPTVAGIVALWLEANPHLTYPEVKQIIEETATLDNKIGTTNKWDEKRGFGKIDAYAGLKKALEMAEASGINDQLNSETPITINNKGNQFHILFNNDESYATISLYNASGVEVKREQLNNIRRGNETVITTENLPAGVYVIRINTTASSASKKMMVK